MGRMTLGIALAAIGVGLTATRADEFAPPISLANLTASEPNDAGSSADLPIHEVGRGRRSADRQFYISGMIGPSFATVSSPGDGSLTSNDTLFNAGGAFGIAFERARGRIRLETEGMGRSTYDTPFASAPTPLSTTILTSNWSVMENLWRDVMITDRVGVYGGGGIGAGGYVFSAQTGGIVDTTPAAANFAWQVGGGLLWEITERLTFDVGYRYFQIDTIDQIAAVEPNQFNASELMFTLRLYEPFRRWTR